MRRHWRLVLAGTVALFVIAYLVASSMGTGTVYYYTVDEIDLNDDHGEVIRLAGSVMPGSLEWRADGPELTFELGPLPPGVDPRSMAAADVHREAGSLGGKTVAAAEADRPDGPVVPVRYTKLKPDLLAEDVEVIAEGTLVDGVFHATQLLVKCPSKYEAEVD